MPTNMAVLQMSVDGKLLVKYFQGEPLKNIDSTCHSPYLLWFNMPTPMAVLQMSADGKLLVKNFQGEPL